MHIIFRIMAIHFSVVFCVFGMPAGRGEGKRRCPGAICEVIPHSSLLQGDVKVRHPFFFSLFSPTFTFSVMLLFIETPLLQKLWSAFWQDTGFQRGFFWSPQGLQRNYLEQIGSWGQPEELSKLPLHLEVNFWSKNLFNKGTNLCSCTFQC